ncbi:MAG: hypothetical protein MZU97_00235 [Bacillus subtilis]|nr:hypothetical protein [Bacillus subtilis]
MIEFFISRKLATPDGYSHSALDIDLLSLKQSGITTLFIDLDNTLISYAETEPTPAIEAFFARIQQLGFRVLIVSNNHEPRIRHFSDLLRVPYLHSATKPLRRGFKKAQRIIGVNNPNESLFDRRSSDDRLNRRKTNGAIKVILVDAIDRTSENWFTKHNRTWEKLVLDHLHKIDPETYERLKLHEKR